MPIVPRVAFLAAFLILLPCELLGQAVAPPSNSVRRLPSPSPVPPTVVEAVQRVRDVHARVSPEREQVRLLAQQVRVARAGLERIAQLPPEESHEEAAALGRLADQIEATAAELRARSETPAAAQAAAPRAGALERVGKLVASCREVAQKPAGTERADLARGLALGLGASSGRLRRDPNRVEEAPPTIHFGPEEAR